MTPQRSFLAPVLLLACALPAAAHEGHGLAASHWHASDVFGLLLVGGMATLAIWLSRGGK